ncbi:MAG: putative metal-binding motif-containing protein, partial [Myxococcota bacterium]|nr:putative metal-binding motif-containing protein [Myxococcota bacterium]
PYTATEMGDCDDFNNTVKPGVIEVCDGVDNDCEGGIDEDLVSDCVPPGFIGSDEFWDNGSCSRGTSICTAGAWSDCVDFLLPEPELCDDGFDNDCNGIVDDEGACATDCVDDICDFSIGEGAGGDDGGDDDEPVFNQPEEDDQLEDCTYDCGYNVGVNDDGYLYLDLTVNVVDVPYMWVANAGDNTVSKHDSVNSVEMARYDVGGGCNPSRTAVNSTGAVWVNCREGSRTIHIAPNESQCIDRNGDGIIQTSTVTYDASGNKTVNQLDWQDDECVLFNGTPTVAASAPQYAKDNPMPTSCAIGLRGLAVRADNTAIMGGGQGGCRDGHMWQVKFDYNPELPYQESVNPSVHVIDHWHLPSLEHTYRDGSGCSFDYDGRAYGYAIDQNQHVWVSSLQNHISWVDLDARRSCSFPTGTTYGIAVDYAGRIWFGNWQGGGAVGRIFEPITKTMHDISQFEDGTHFWNNTSIPESQHTRGAAASSNPDEPYGYFNMSNGNTGPIKVKVINEDPNNFQARIAGIMKLDEGGVCGNDGSGCGISLDGEGDLWVVWMDTCGSSNVDNTSHGYAVSTEHNPDDIEGWIHPQGEEAKAYVKSMIGQGSYTYTYSDFMGYQFATIIDPTGFYIQRFNGWGAVDGGQSTEWVRMVVEIMETENVPPLYLSYRASDTPEQLALQSFSEPVLLECEAGTCTYEPEYTPLGGILDMKLTLKKNETGGSVTIKELRASGKKYVP